MPPDPAIAQHFSSVSTGEERVPEFELSPEDDIYISLPALAKGAHENARIMHRTVNAFNTDMAIVVTISCVPNEVTVMKARCPLNSTRLGTLKIH